MTEGLNDKFQLNKNPFSKFSAEEELEFLHEIFFHPKFYGTLLDDLKTGTSRFILGQRGHGKSSIIHQLKRDLNASRILTVVVDRFDDIPLSNNKIELLQLVLAEFVTSLALYIEKNKHVVKLLNKEDKENFSLLLKLFFKPLTRLEFENRYDHVHKIKVKNWFIKFFNRVLKPTNALINTGVMITSSLIAQRIGVGEMSEVKFKDFLAKMDTIETSPKNAENQLKSDKRHLKSMLSVLGELTKKLNFNSCVVLFDKVDEFQELNQDINKIALFSRDILTDTELLLQNNIAIAFGLWNEVKPTLSKDVRFDKFKEIDISWNKVDLKPLMDKRINYFSNGMKTFSDLFDDSNDLDQVLEISNFSPRDMIACMSDIYDYQLSNPNVEKFTSTAVSKGLIKFAQRFDYFSLYPSRVGKNKDVKSMIELLLRNRKNTFGVKDLMSSFNQKNGWCNKKLELMEQYKLIRLDQKLGENGERVFNILDPKIRHLISRNITSLDN